MGRADAHDAFLVGCVQHGFRYRQGLIQVGQDAGTDLQVLEHFLGRFREFGAHGRGRNGAGGEAARDKGRQTITI